MRIGLGWIKWIYLGGAGKLNGSIDRDKWHQFATRACVTQDAVPKKEQEFTHFVSLFLLKKLEGLDETRVAVTNAHCDDGW